MTTAAETSEQRFRPQPVWPRDKSLDKLWNGPKCRSDCVRKENCNNPLWTRSKAFERFNEVIIRYNHWSQLCSITWTQPLKVWSDLKGSCWLPVCRAPSISWNDEDSTQLRWSSGLFKQDSHLNLPVLLTSKWRGEYPTQTETLCVSLFQHLRCFSQQILNPQMSYGISDFLI